MFAQFQTPRESGGSTEEFAEWGDGGTPATEVGTTPGSTLRPPSGEKQEQQQPSPAASPHPYSTTSKTVSSSRSTSSSQDVTEETSSVTSCSVGGSPNSHNVHSLFNKAYEYLNPGCSFRRVVHLYAERKLLVFFLIHFACTMIIWCESVLAIECVRGKANAFILTFFVLFFFLCVVDDCQFTLA